MIIPVVQLSHYASLDGSTHNMSMCVASLHRKDSCTQEKEDISMFAACVCVYHALIFLWTLWTAWGLPSQVLELRSFWCISTLMHTCSQFVSSPYPLLLPIVMGNATSFALLKEWLLLMSKPGWWVVGVVSRHILKILGSADRVSSMYCKWGKNHHDGYGKRKKFKAVWRQESLMIFIFFTLECLLCDNKTAFIASKSPTSYLIDHCSSGIFWRIIKTEKSLR